MSFLGVEDEGVFRFLDSIRSFLTHAAMIVFLYLLS